MVDFLEKPVFSVLLVGGNAENRDELRRALEDPKYEIIHVPAGEEAQALITQRTESFDVIVTHLKLLKGTGLSVLHTALEKDEDTSVLVITAHGSIESAVEALKLGAYDYLTKPIDFERLRIGVRKAVERRKLALEVRALREAALTSSAFPGIIARSEAMKRVLTTIEQVADTDATILLLGESGTGKELIARAIHQKSARRGKPFVAVNCGSLPETLAESELFGYEKGAFTGADRRKIGRFEMADGGTIFLDEIAEMDLRTQVLLLRVLETQEFRRVGGTELVKVSVRTLAATNQELSTLTVEGKFREDLYYRLNVIPVRLPSLRERAEDIPVLAEFFCEEFNRRYARKVGLAPETFRSLSEYPWPGNVRELKNLVERLVLTSQRNLVTSQTLRKELSKSPKEELLIRIGTTIEEAERLLIVRTLRSLGNHREQTAKRLGISVRSLHYKLKRFGLS